MVRSPLTVFWTPTALGDLDRFAEFLFDAYPQLSTQISDAIISAADVLADLPHMGRPISGKTFRRLVMPVRNGSYVLQYRIDGRRIVILRVFHGRERRDH